MVGKESAGLLEHGLRRTDEGEVVDTPLSREELTTDVKGLVERWKKTMPLAAHQKLVDETIAALEAAEADKERLEEELIVVRGANASLRLSLHGCNAFAEAQEFRAEQSEAREQRLREALRELVRLHYMNEDQTRAEFGPVQKWHDAMCLAWEAARAALADQQATGGEG